MPAGRTPPSVSDARQQHPRAAAVPTPGQPAEPFSDRPGAMRIGPTSDRTRRLVAESRMRQGLPPRIENPAVIESLALFLRNALKTLDRDDGRDHDRDRGHRAA